MAQHRVVIAGLVHNNAQYLNSLIESLKRLGSLFLGYAVEVFENDSHDNSSAILKSWANANPHVRVVSRQGLGAANRSAPPVATRTHPGGAWRRTVKLADWRQDILSWVKTAYPTSTYLLWVDTDTESIDVGGVWTSFERHDWDLVCGNGAYDKFAWRAKDDTADVFDEGFWRSTFGKQVPIADNGAWMPCWSCFGGLAIYRLSSLARCSYYATGDCEHIGLHQCMHREGFTCMWMNPRMVR